MVYSWWKDTQDWEKDEWYKTYKLIEVGKVKIVLTQLLTLELLVNN